MQYSDPYSARQLAHARILEAEWHRNDRRPVRTRRRALSSRVGPVFRSVFTPRRTTPFDRSLPIFAGLGDRRLQDFEAHFEVRRFVGGEILGREGEPVHEFHLVLEGRVGVVIDDEVVGVLEPGTHFGALGILHPVANPARATTLHALDRGLVAVASRAQFTELMDEFPSVAAHVRNVVRRRRNYFRTRTIVLEPTGFPVTVSR